MRTHPHLSLLFVFVLLFGLAAQAAAAPPAPQVPAAPAADPITVNLSATPSGDLVLDPALASSGADVAAVEQLFIGLVDLDDETAEPQPELATSWVLSPDRTVYTFTLRSDVTWSDGKPVTAGDVQYGILRSLDPALETPYGYVLGMVIQNAEAYYQGTITDPDQVGVTTLDDTHLEITLNQPAAYALSILSMWVARPMPQWAIEAHGDAWTEPGNIVTNGPYLLSEWTAGDHLTLEKNPNYYDAAGVQIERAVIWLRSQADAWTMYQAGQLDTATVPLGTALDPVQAQEAHYQPVACLYYYGFTTTQPPFDNPLVRKAFAAATDRFGLIQNVTKGGQRPALTFTPPGVPGAVDGAAEGIGIPYNPVQARQYLADAGYANGQGLPPVTLWHNTSTGHQAIAEYLVQGWQAALGISVARQDMEWQAYLGEVGNGAFQVWRMGWCLDYADANNFLRDVLARGGAHNPTGGGLDWDNPAFESLVMQAAWETDPAVRKNLYKQAEEILVETDAVIIPIYHYASSVASKAYLVRKYGIPAVDVATWRITAVSEPITPESGGTLVSDDGSTTIEAPAGAFDEAVTLTQAPAAGPPPTGALAGIGRVFEVTAVYTESGDPAPLEPGASVAFTVAYTDGERGAVIEDTLGLYAWDGSAWSQDGITSSVDPLNNVITAEVEHFSLFAVLGETRRVYLPVAIRMR